MDKNDKLNVKSNSEIKARFERYHKKIRINDKWREVL